MDDEALEEEDIMLDAGEGEGPTTVEEGAATVKDPEEEPLNESMDIQTTIYISCTDTFRIFAILTYI